VPFILQFSVHATLARATGRRTTSRTSTTASAAPGDGRVAPLHRRRRADPADHSEASHLAVEAW